MVLWLGTIVAVLILTGRLFYWQVLRYEYLQDVGDKLRLQPKPIPSLRGAIMDRHGFVLAMDEYEFEVFATPRDADEPDRLVGALAPILGVGQPQLSELLSRTDQDYVRLAQGVPLKAARAVEEVKQDWINAGLHIRGLGILPTRHRVYPERVMACHLLGFVTRAHEAFYGIEEFYDEQLRGVEGSWGGSGDILDLQITLGPGKLALPQDGQDLILTLDRTIQQIAEEELRHAITEYQAEGGTVIVMSPQTGAVLAMVSYPGYDPNLYFEEATRGEPFTDPAVSEMYEPGSVFKIVTMAAALDTGMVDRHSTYNDLGQIFVGGALIQNWDGRAYGVIDMTDLLRYSLNVGAATLSTNLGGDRFYDYVQRFGFGEPTGIDLPYESGGLVKMPGDADWREADLGTNAFGQGISVTPIQMITAVAAVANKGVLPTPHVVQRIEQRGEVIKEFHPEPRRRVISAAVAQELTDMLVEFIASREELTIPGYATAGKTGTAQVPVVGGYHPEHTIGSFVGYAPARDPQFVVLVKIDTPQKSPWGIVVAAPAFKRIAERLFVYLSIPPDQLRVASR